MKQPNQVIQRNTFIFGIAMVVLHIAIPLIYGFCISNTTSYINVSSIISAIALALLTIAGFGLVFSYLKRLAWSGLGFAFLITALCVEIYPLVNAFWTKVRLDGNPISNTFTSSRYFTLFVANGDVPTGANYSNTITTGFRCALAVLAAFSSILGRAGSLECLIVSLFGIVGFELNRQIIINLANDSFGTFSIFTFGGFMGLALGIILYLRERREPSTSTEKHPIYTSNSSTTSIAIFGALIIFAVFPFLAFDLDAYHGINMFNLYTGPFYIIIAMGAAVIGSVIISCLINGHLIIRDLIHAPIAGGIIAGSASFFITNPVYALVVGFTGGATQAFIQNYFEKWLANNGNIVSTISWALFGIQGLFGGVFATGYRNILTTNTNGVNFSAKSIDFNAGYQLLIAVISAGIGLGFGLLAGLIIVCFNGHQRDDLFSDKQHWINDDGVSQNLIKAEDDIIEIVIKTQATPPPPPKTAEGPMEQADEVDIYFSNNGDEVKNNFAYL